MANSVLPVSERVGSFRPYEAFVQIFASASVVFLVMRMMVEAILLAPQVSL
jgi:hypothetical protein